MIDWTPELDGEVRSCPDCGGTGRDVPDRSIEDGRGPIAEACWLCRGTGEAPEEDGQ